MRILLIAIAIHAVTACSDRQERRHSHEETADCDQEQLLAAPVYEHDNAKPCPAGTQLRRTSPSGKQQLACVDGDGKRQGPSWQLDDRGSLSVAGNFRDDLRHGFFDLWGSGSRLHSIPFCAGVRHGEATYWHAGTTQVASQGSFRHGAKQGRWRDWYADGTLARVEHYVDGLEHGRFEAWSNDGTALGEFRMERGTGTWVEWHATGKELTRGEMRGGKRVGRWTTWYETGKIESEGEYRDGAAHGPWVFFFPNGQRRREGAFELGREVGVWREWDESGAVIP
jgi:antitoxin component YwqK of YwqJK toxin-antitoxin module